MGRVLITTQEFSYTTVHENSIQPWVIGFITHTTTVQKKTFMSTNLMDRVDGQTNPKTYDFWFKGPQV